MFTRHAISERPGSGFFAWMLRLSWAVACAAYAFPAFSESVPLWTVFNPENSDLPHTDILALTFDAEGTLWIGTHGGGVARLDKDGRWKTYSTVSTKGGLPHDLVQAVAVGADGAVWIGTEHGLARLDKDGTWKIYTSANTDGGLPHDHIMALAPRADGALWVGTEHGLARRDGNGHWQKYTAASTKGELPNDKVYALALDADGVWIGTMGGGVAQLGKNERWQTYNRANTKAGLPSDDVRVLTATADGALWVGTLGGGLARRDRDGRWRTYTSTKSGLPIDFVWSLAPGADGAIWIGTRFGGLARLDRDERWQTYDKTKGGLPAHAVWSLASSADGALWIGTFGGGLARLDVDRRWQTYTGANTKGGLPSDEIRVLTAADRVLWVGTLGGGLARRDKDGTWRTYSKANTKGSLPSDGVTALAHSADGTLWIGTFHGGLARRDKDGGWKTYNRANTKGGLPNDDILSLAPGADGDLWIGTAGGLARLDRDGNWKNYTTASTKGELPNDKIFGLALEVDGVWIGTMGGGVARLDRDGRWQRYNRASTNGGLPIDDVTALTATADGTLWVATFHGGLARRDKDGRWQAYGTAHGLANDRLGALAAGADGALWIGTEGGLARRNKDSAWRTYTKANTNGGLPDDVVVALAPAADGGVWIGTRTGLAHFRDEAGPTHRIVEVIGESAHSTETTQTVAVVAFDSGYRTEPSMFRYVWRMTDPDGKPVSEDPTPTRSPVYRASFDRDGAYHLRVNAIDRYGAWSEPRYVNFNVDLPKPEPVRKMLVEAAKQLGLVGVLYFALILPLIPLYPRYSWARTAVNSGWFTKFPVAHKAVVNTRWARRHLFRRLAERGSATPGPEPYIPQSLFAAADQEPQPLSPDGGRASLAQIFARERRALLLARSGTGKSVFLRHLLREVAARFQRGERVPVPLLIDLRTNVLTDRTVQDLVRDALRGAGVELENGVLDFLIGKGGFLILVDSLNELPKPDDARRFHTFFSQDANNFVLIASQVDLLRRQDTPVFNLAEVTPEQAASYLADAIGRDLYADLPPEAQALARNPQDLALLAEVAKALGTARVPTRRAELYREILKHDGALSPWVESGDPLMAVIYGVAFRMVDEHRVLQDGQLRDWIAADSAAGGDGVGRIVKAMQASRLFRGEVERDVLGKEQPVTGFRHELIGKFLAARHVRRMIGPGAQAGVDYVGLSGDERWLDMFYFVVDEIDSAPVLNRFLRELLAAGGPCRMRITAYAIGTRRAELGREVLLAYEKAKLDEDLALTPAA